MESLRQPDKILIFLLFSKKLNETDSPDNERAHWPWAAWCSGWITVSLHHQCSEIKRFKAPFVHENLTASEVREPVILCQVTEASRQIDLLCIYDTSPTCVLQSKDKTRQSFVPVSSENSRELQFLKIQHLFSWSEKTITLSLICLLTDGVDLDVRFRSSHQSSDWPPSSLLKELEHWDSLTLFSADQ